MPLPRLTRHELTRIAAAALGGVVVGTALCGCSDSASRTTSGSSPTSMTQTASAAMPADKHACKGLNGCKGEGNDGKNACAGQGGCATKEAVHNCKGHNACKGMGGCGESAGANMCQGKGNCAVPMKADGWKKARESFETKMKSAGKTVGQPS